MKKVRRQKDNAVLSKWKVSRPFAGETNVFDKYDLTWRHEYRKVLHVEMKLLLTVTGFRMMNQILK